MIMGGLIEAYDFFVLADGVDVFPPMIMGGLIEAREILNGIEDPAVFPPMIMGGLIEASGAVTPTAEWRYFRP